MMHDPTPEQVVRSLGIAQHITQLRAIRAEVAAARMAARRSYVAKNFPSRTEYFRAAEDHACTAIEALCDLLVVLDPTEEPITKRADR